MHRTFLETLVHEIQKAIENPGDPCATESYTIDLETAKRLGYIERKWPDDFRGFGTNVKPKKQK